MNPNIYSEYANKYIPNIIKYLFIAESPPAFKGSIPESYFYFDICPRADPLFYSLIYAVFGIKFNKYLHNRIAILDNFKECGYFLVDAVEYPINKYLCGKKIPNDIRENFISDNVVRITSKINCLRKLGLYFESTKIILIKETVYNQLSDKFTNILNNTAINFPRYINDREFVNDVRELLKIS